jgi:site-specific DNA-methyltransferase (cytosine-N4-specific)
MTRPASDLPVGSEFSPSQIDLPVVLELVEQHEGDAAALEAAILKRYFSGHAKGRKDKEGREYNRWKLANNCKLGLIGYKIIDRKANFTAFGKELAALRGDEKKLYATLARHILLNLNGMAMIQCVQDMTVAGDKVTLETLREGLAARGLNLPSGGKHPSMMRLWLVKAGVVLGARWQIDEIRLQEVLGTASTEFEALAHFTPEQRAFLRALANTGTRTAQPANDIARLAAATYGVRFPEKSLPKAVLNPLVQAGFITAEKTTDGRGAKPFHILPTAKLDAEIIGPLLDQLKKQTDPKLLDLLKKPLETILAEMKSADRFVSGLALEALAFKLMRLLDMTYVATRLRAQATGGAEVDLIFESARLVFSRWQVQCKNTARVSLDDVAKEVGLTHFLKSNVIVVVTTGDIGAESRRYANKIMRDSNLAIVMLDGADLTAINDKPAAIVDVFNREARTAMKLKVLEALE